MRILVLAFLMVFCAVNAQAGGVKVKTVEAQGVGETREDAIKAALAEAVGRVSGTEISARDRVRTVSKQTMQITDKSESFSSVSEDKLQREVLTSSRGTVRSYQVIDVVPVPNSPLLRAKLSVDVNYFELGKDTERTRIAVLPFSVHHAVSNHEELNRILLTINQSIISYLTGTRNFAVLDRNFEKKRLNELASLLRPDVRLEERARIGNTLATDYIVTGVISDFNYSDQLESVPYVNEKRRVVQGNIAIEWCVIEASTGQIMMADTSAKTIKTNTDFSKEGRRLGETIGAKITSQIYPLAAIDFKNGQFILAQGATSLRVGDVYTLVRQGAIRYNPYTQEPLGREEFPVGLVRISRVLPKMGYAEIVECKEDPSGMAPREYILRPLDEATATTTAKNKTQRTAEPQW